MRGAMDQSLWMIEVSAALPTGEDGQDVNLCASARRHDGNRREGGWCGALSEILSSFGRCCGIC